MKTFFKNIDKRLLPRHDNIQFAPYVWLVYLFMFFTSLVAYHPVANSYIYASIGTVFFLFFYFNAYWVSSKTIKWNIIAILIIGSFLAQLTPGASVFFVYGAAFCCRLGSTKKAFMGVISISLWIALLSWYFEHATFFYIPAVLFTYMIGGLNIYQHDIDLKRKELVLSQQEVRQLARTSERERIARDLHDLIGHTFSVITLKAELANKLIDKDIPKAKQQITELETISRDALKQIREVVTGYRTSDLSTELAHAKYVLESNDINFEYQLDELDVNDKINKELAIILKELITNILKHAEADKVRASVTVNKNNIVLLVVDDGLGFQQKETKGYGLKGIEERVQKLSGRFDIKSDAGSEFTLSIPLEVSE